MHHTNTTTNHTPLGRKCAECTETYFETLLSAHGKPQFYYQFLYNVKASNATHRIVPFPMSSSEAARAMRKWKMHPDLIYIDASHDAIDVLQVGIKLIPILGSIIGFH